MGEVEPLADLAVRQTGGGERGDLEFLGAEPVPRGRRPVRTALACGPQQPAGVVTPVRGAEAVEDVPGLAQRCPGLDGTAPAAQPVTVGEKQPGAVGRPPARVARQGLREAELGAVVVREHGPGVLQAHPDHG